MCNPLWVLSQSMGPRRTGAWCRRTGVRLVCTQFAPCPEGRLLRLQAAGGRPSVASPGTDARAIARAAAAEVADGAAANGALYSEPEDEDEMPLAVAAEVRWPLVQYDPLRRVIFPFR